MRLRTLRLLAVSVLLAVTASFLGIMFRHDTTDPDGMLAAAKLIAGVMVLGTAAYGLSIWLLRCPDCGRSLGRAAAGRIDPTGQSVVASIIVLLRPFRCEACGFDERNEQRRS